ncbi:CoA transferase subunit A [Parasporobacterium paucivorans]|uniref:Butyryl-CoA:acetoacetate CoA-transferase alpha subunit n=1 Tax=Parasporobacterium paucivorans DSM 15970 TaxID=1122934 RepID=A0A1M6BXP4_9FIRM|nr:CoA transferase subunit A [Parasporobacterium paucivorans]SHI53467.1 butyryl-CoA:acetoacetate CoA-transferase alpha subunit [Parasporobacterium paucivorans DSM 15970]
MKNKMITAEEAAKLVKDGSVVMIGGFMSIGTPEILMDALIADDTKDLTVIANDAGTQTTGIGKLVAEKRVKKLIASHIGLNPEMGRQMSAGEAEVELVPQGSLAEMIRAGGAGLGGVLTPTGLGTDVANGKQTVVVDGKEFLLERALRADVALIRGSIVDKAGNVFYNATTRNFNPMMATAADVVIVAAEKIVEVGEIDPNYVMTPYIFVDYIVGGER